MRDIIEVIETILIFNMISSITHTFTKENMPVPSMLTVVKYTSFKEILQSVRDSQHLLTYVYYIGCA